MNYILLVASALASSLKGLICKKIGTDNSDPRRIHFINGVLFFVAAMEALVFAALSGTLRLPSPQTLILAAVFSASLLFTQLVQTYAMKLGPASITTLIYATGLVLPILYGSVFLAEAISPMQIIGTAAVALALFLIIDPKKDRSFSAKWLIFSFLAAAGSGTSAIIQKVHQSSAVQDELGLFLITGLLLCALYSFILARPAHPANRPAMTAGSVRFMLFSGLSIGALNILNLYLAGKLPAIIQFPIYNIGSMILTSLGGRLFFGEKMSGKKLAGFAFGCADILMIGLG